ncbi:UbiX family flavin prenyltransferase [Bradyrhizobium sp. STM 3809]|uniref:UbiX family flavin prenyltransferase n=1 Tax=Bradyrhizobium sp. STM 3809 TaxID=551936 RepID=UPI0002407080|nr:UbiX family flavin prenyltransferase [Bradyrhizobium sp. STM 3809]CCD97727.1 3-octaprenyl-4-hydroxybenzoate carboxy-lyase [Bradyrhizobium sp. STM 3809]
MRTPFEPPRMIVGVSGATGVVYAIRLLELLRELRIESHLVITKPGEMTLAYETDLSTKQLRDKADVSYLIGDIGAAIASGSFRTIGMVVAPCSMRTVGEIASCATSNLLTRAADVCLKERRRLVLMVRETPLHAGHLKALLAATESGAIIFPPVPAFYAKPASLSAMVDHSIGRVLDLFELDAGLVERWGGTKQQRYGGSKPFHATPKEGNDPC